MLSSKLVADTLVIIDLADEDLDSLMDEASAGVFDCFRLAPCMVPLLVLAYLRYIWDNRPSVHSIVVGFTSPYSSPTVTHFGFKVDTWTKPRLILVPRCVKVKTLFN